jgi:hypothetical protein
MLLPVAVVGGEGGSSVPVPTTTTSYSSLRSSIVICVCVCVVVVVFVASRYGSRWRLMDGGEGVGGSGGQ